jgi:hypothetical protein
MLMVGHLKERKAALCDPTGFSRIYEVDKAIE